MVVSRPYAGAEDGASSSDDDLVILSSTHRERDIAEQSISWGAHCAAEWAGLLLLDATDTVVLIAAGDKQRTFVAYYGVASPGTRR